MDAIQTRFTDKSTKSAIKEPTICAGNTTTSSKFQIRHRTQSVRARENLMKSLQN